MMSLSRYSFLLFLAALLTQPQTMLFAADKPTPEQVIQRHLENLGMESVETFQAPRLVTGIGAMKVLDGGTGFVQGQFGLESSPEKISLKFEFPSQGYPRDGFTLESDGEFIPEQTSPGNNSFLGGFFDGNRDIARSGLVGSVLSAAWPFVTPGTVEKLQCKYDGEKKVEKEKADVLKCEVNSVISSYLYFEKKTGRHIQTVHRVPPDRGNALLTEEFLGFQRINGIELPARWLITLEYRGNRRVKWEVALQNIGRPEE